MGASHPEEALMINSPLEGRPVRESLSEYTQVALPNDANTHGSVLGGHIMHLIDLCGAVAGTRHARGVVATASVSSMSFLLPVRVGQLLILKSSVNRVFHSSMEVGVKVWVQDLNTGQVHHTSSAYLTFVTVDENGKPVCVPPVLPETEDEKRRFEEAGRRRESRLHARGDSACSK